MAGGFYPESIGGMDLRALGDVYLLELGLSGEERAAPLRSTRLDVRRGMSPSVCLQSDPRSKTPHPTRERPGTAPALMKQPLAHEVRGEAHPEIMGAASARWPEGLVSLPGRAGGPGTGGGGPWDAAWSVQHHEPGVLLPLRSVRMMQDSPPGQDSSLLDALIPGVFLLTACVANPLQRWRRSQKRTAKI